MNCPDHKRGERIGAAMFQHQNVAVMRLDGLYDITVDSRSLHLNDLMR
mgnify:CR=1 FL=1